MKAKKAKAKKSTVKKAKIKKLSKSLLKKAKGGSLGTIPSRCASSSSCRGGYCNRNCGRAASRSPSPSSRGTQYAGLTPSPSSRGGSSSGGSVNRAKAGRGQTK